MDAIKPFLDDFARQALGAAGTITVMGVLFAVLGLGAGVGAVVFCGRRGMMKREVRAWHWAAKLHYVYVPGLLMVVGGSLGAVYGAQRVCRGWIDRSTAPVVGYAQAYLPALQSSVNQSLGLREGEEVSVEELVAREMNRRMQAEGAANPFVRQAVYQLNLAIVHHTLDQVEVPREAKRPVDAIRHLDLSNLDPRTFELLPRTLHGAAGSFFIAKYIVVWGFFLPFLLIPVVEYLGHRGYCWWRGRKRARSAVG